MPDPVALVGLDVGEPVPGAQERPEHFHVVRIGSDQQVAEPGAAELLGRRVAVHLGHRVVALGEVAVPVEVLDLLRFGLVDRERLVELDPPDAFGGLGDESPIALLGLVQRRVGPLALDRHRDLSGDEREDVLLFLAVADALRVGLHRHDADGAIPDLEGHADPVERRGADQFRLAAPHEVLVHVRRGEQRPPGAHHVLGQAASQRPLGCLPVVLIHEVREGQPVALGVDQRDVEVLGRHQLIHDLVQRAQQGLEVRGGERRLGDAVRRLLDPLGALAWRQVVVVDHDRADRGLVQAVDRDGLEVAIRAVLVPDTELRAQRHTRLRQQLFEQMPRALDVVGMQQVEATPAHELLRRIAEQPCGGAARVGRHPLRVYQGDGVGAVLDQRAEPLLALAQRGVGRGGRGGRGGQGGCPLLRRALGALGAGPHRTSSWGFGGDWQDDAGLPRSAARGTIQHLAHLAC